MKQSLEEIAASVRRRIVEVSYHARVPHLGSSLSCVEILVAAYFELLRVDPASPGKPDRDFLILSKGHAAVALYSVLAERGYFDPKVLTELNNNGSRLGEQPSPGYPPGVEFATGSLGHGLPVGAGLALAASLSGKQQRVVVVVSDGECNEGSTWEAAMFAAGKGLGNLTVIVDANGWQATGRSREILALEPLVAKWSSFGWDAIECDGHNSAEIVRCARDGDSKRPRAIVARTTKGRGVSFMEDDNNWHYRIPDEDEFLAAMKELSVERRTPAGA